MLAQSRAAFAWGVSIALAANALMEKQTQGLARHEQLPVGGEPLRIRPHELGPKAAV